MIVREKPGVLDILFALRGSILPRIATRLALITLVAAGAVVAAQRQPGIFAQIGATPFTLIGLALSIFMSFRNNACYDRWWEGRKQWGALIIAARSLARQAALLDEAPKRGLLRGICGFSAGLAARLRWRNPANVEEAAAIANWIEGVPASAPNPTDAAVRQMGELTQRLLLDGAIDRVRWHALEEQLCALSTVQASCERIAATPVPFAYSLLLHRTAHVFCLSLPFALAGTMGWWTLLPCALVSYTFFGLDALGDQLEDPFGTEPNDLPIEAMLRTIQREMLATLGESALPPPLAPHDFVLM